MRYKNVTKSIPVDINGRKSSLNSYLLGMPERPVPPAPTHYVMVDILNKDLSIKRITIYYNPQDTWTNSESSCFINDRPRWIGDLIGGHLGFLALDPNTMAYTYWLIEVVTNSVICKGFQYDFCNPDTY